jgi:hypothetical protein
MAAASHIPEVCESTPSFNILAFPRGGWWLRKAPLKNAVRGAASGDGCTRTPVGDQMRVL